MNRYPGDIYPDVQPAQSLTPATAPTPQGDPMAADFWATLPPQERQKALAHALRSGTLSKQSDSLEAQLEKAGMTAPSGPPRIGPWAAGIGGLADVLNAIGDKAKEDRLRAQQDKIWKALEAERLGYADAATGVSPGPKQTGFLGSDGRMVGQ